MTPRCVACGMPMGTPDDDAMCDVSKDRRLRCARDDGSMKSYEETVESIGRFVVKTEGLAPDAVREKARKWMAKLPSRQNRG